MQIGFDPLKEFGCKSTYDDLGRSILPMSDHCAMICEHGGRPDDDHRDRLPGMKEGEPINVKRKTSFGAHGTVAGEKP